MSIINNAIRLCAALAFGAMSCAVSAQYVVTFNDGARLEVFGTPGLGFDGDGDDVSLVIGDASYRLDDVRVLEYSGKRDEPIVLAYHPYYASNNLPNPDIVTHINYGFAEVYVKNGEYQKFKLQSSETQFRKIVKMKEQNPNLKICLSFTHTVVNGDNRQDGGFSAIAANETYRKAFARDCLDFIERWGIDGIDLDWEFPGISWSGAACDPAHDVENYTLLIQELRATLGERYLLTFAGYCMDKRTTTGGYKYIDLAAVEPYVDFVNVMTYDFDEAPRYHNAIKSAASYWDIERTVSAYNKAKFPMRKFVLGIPFYVRNSFSGASVAYRSLSNLSPDDGYVIDNWNETARVPYITLNGKMWGSYDNPRSIAVKGEYGAEKNMRGLFYWCTYEDDADYTLASAVWQAVRDNFPAANE